MFWLPANLIPFLLLAPLKAKVLPPKLWVMCESANFTRCHTICEISFAPSNEWRTKPRIANGLKVLFCVCGWNSSWAWSCLATWWKTNWQAKTESELSIFKTHRLLSDQQRWHAVKHLTLSANSEQQPTGYSGGENEGDSKGILCKGKQEPKIEGTSGHCPHTFAENRKERQLAAEIAGEIEAVIEAYNTLKNWKKVWV